MKAKNTLFILIGCFLPLMLDSETLSLPEQSKSIHSFSLQNDVQPLPILSQEDRWLKKLQEALVVSEKIRSSVERNRLKRFLKRMETETQDLSEIPEENQFLSDYQQKKWQWIANKLTKRQTDAQLNLPEGIDKTVITSLLHNLIQEVSKKVTLHPESAVASVNDHLKDETEQGRQLIINELLNEMLPLVKEHLRDFSPVVFISYAWGPNEKPFVKQLAEQLKMAGIDVRLDIWHNGLSTARITDFVNEIEQVDYIILVGSELYGEKYRNSKNSLVFIEARVIAERYRAQPNRILPLLLSGTAKESIPSFLRDQVYAQFTDQEHYVQQLSGLILALCKYADDYPGLKMILDKIEKEASDRIRATTL